MNIDIDKIINIVYNDNKVSFALLFNHQLYMTNQNRFLRSKRLRSALWYATDGKCQICGCDLPDRWHADHIERWAETQRTNVHEMQALCPQCHINKTIEENRIMNNNDQGTQLSLFPSEPLKLRKHQEEFFQICNLIKAGEPIQRIIMLVTPGGGKSVIPVIAAAKLIPSKTSGASFYGTIADSICWIVPRLNLQEQAELNFIDPHFQQMLNHSHKIRANNNDPNPPKGTSGYAATYQAIAANPSLHAQEIQRRRYILVLDEFHHVEQDSQWHKALQPLVDAAVLVIMVTGTYERWDERRIAFMPYKSVNQDCLTPDLSNNQDTRIIRYTRGDALRESAIVPLHFELKNAQAQWVDSEGEICKVESLAEAGKDTNAAIWTVLNTEYAYSLLSECVENWKEHKKINLRAKLLVIAPSIAKADEYVKWLKDLEIRAKKATSDESKEAQEAIRSFKKQCGQTNSRGAVDVLVTVQMAYEGLDVPAITHIACLTRIRSVPWLEQAWARGARVDRDSKGLKDKGIIYIPDDKLAENCMQKILAEQEPILREKEQNRLEQMLSNKDSQKNLLTDGIIPLKSNLTSSRAMDLSNGEAIDYSESAKIQLAMKQANIGGISTIQMKYFIKAYSQPVETGDSYAFTKDSTNTESLTPRQEEEKLRDTIENYTRRYALKNQLDFKIINGEIKLIFKKERKSMTIQELRKVWAWLQKNYPMND